MLGIDVGATAIKLAIMRRQRRRWHLQACVVQPLPEHTGGYCDANSTVVLDTLKMALASLSVKAREAAVAVASADAIIRTIELDGGLSEQEIENRLAIEAGQHLPFPVSDASMDFCRLPGGNNTRASRLDVLLVACRREEVERRVALLRSCDIRTAVVDLDALAFYRLIGDEGPDVTEVILDLGAGGFRLHAFAQGRLLYSRSHQAGIRAGAPSSQIAEPESEPRLVQEIRRAIQLFLISTACEHEITIKLAGGAAANPGLAAGISAACGRPVSAVQTLPGNSSHARVAPGRRHTSLPQLALACGLAMAVG